MAAGIAPDLAGDGLGKSVKSTALKTLSGGLLLAALTVGGYIMLSDFANLRKVQTIDSPMEVGELVLPQPWGGYAWRRLSRVAGDSAALDSETARSTLLAAAVRYPVDAVQWLDLARIQVRQGNATGVDKMLARANAVQPLERRSLWAAAQVALQSDNQQLAERQLRQWLRLYPQDTAQALFIGSRWIEAPGELLDRMLPDGREYLVETMQVARQQSNPALAEAVWQRLEPAPELADPLFLNFIELLLATGQMERAIELWAGKDETFSPGGLANGNFTRPLGESMGLNWRVDRVPPGMRIARDHEESFSPPASLKIEFNGKENIRSRVPWIRVPVQPGQHYRLSGAWRAEGLTTRSLPFLHLVAEQGNLGETLEVPDTQFEWETWAIEFQAPEETRMVRLQLRRDRTQAFDRNIAGTLWLDDFSLQQIIAPKTLQIIASEALGRIRSAPETPPTTIGADEAIVRAVSGREPAGQDEGTVYGKNPRDSAGAGGVGAVSGREPAGQDEGTVYGLRFTVYGKTTPETGNGPSTDVGAGSAGEERGPETKIAAAEANSTGPDAPARKPYTGASGARGRR